MKFLLRTNISHHDFVERSLSINHRVFCAGAIFGVIIQIINMVRVLVTNAKLSTLNNRIYFTFYLVYFIFCGAFLLVEYLIRMASETKYRFYMLCGVIILCWHMLFNIYDIYRANAVGYFTIITVIFFFSGLFMFRPVFTITVLGISGVVFTFVLNHLFSSGEVINFTLTVLLCVIMYLVRYKHLKIEILQAKQIRAVQQELEDVHRDFRLTIEQYELIREKESSVTFEWNIQDDCIRFSKEWSYYFNQSENIYNFHQYIKNLTFLTEEYKEMLLNCMENIRKGISYQKYELILPTRRGEQCWFELRVITQVNDIGEPVLGIGMLSDITDQKEKINQLETKVQMDLFTGLLNKTSIERYGKKKLEKLQKGQMLAALILDMDNFKDINDQYGHPVGDFVLKEVAMIMRKYAPEGVRIGRIGGDEFMALLITDNLTEFKNYAWDLIEKVSQIKWEGSNIFANCSIGIAVASSPDERYDALYQRTDEALYQAKKNGKNQVYYKSLVKTENGLYIHIK